jgi:MFS family permease
MAITGFVIGAHVDRRGPKGIMLIGTLILSLALFALSKVTQLWHWVLINGVILTVGAALIGYLVVNVTLIKWFVDFRGRAVAFAAMGVSFAGVLLMPFTTWAIDTYDWRFTWQLLALLTLVLVIPAALSMRRAPEDYGLRPDGRSDEDFQLGLTQHAIDDFDHSVTRREALRSSTFYWLVIVFSLFPVTIQVMLLQTIPMMTDVGYDRTTAALMITVASVPALLSKPVWGWLIDGLQRPKPLAALSASIAGCSLFIIVFSVNAGFLGGLIGGFFLLGLGWGGMIPLQEVIWASFFGRRYLGAVRGAAMPFMLVLGAMAPISTSYYYDVVGNYDGAIIAVGCANLVSAFMIMLIKNHNTPAL